MELKKGSAPPFPVTAQTINPFYDVREKIDFDSPNAPHRDIARVQKAKIE